MSLTVDNEKNYAELLLIINPFFSDFENSELQIFHSTKSTDKNILINVEIGDKKYSYKYSTKPEMYVKNVLENKYVKRYGKIGLYRALSEYTGKSLAWGSLTGVRPTKLFYECLKTQSFSEAKKTFLDLYKVSKEKTKIVEEIIHHQGKKSTGDKDINLYVHIPFCPSKCTYCSFVSYSIARYNNMLSQYVDNLIYEITESLKLIRKKKYNLRSIYIGGGTPTILSCDDLERLLKALNVKVEEFTIESGRPETMTKEKLEIMKANGVTRVCVNPQSFNKEVLVAVNRPQNIEDIKNAVLWAKELGFVVNMDLIAGLPNDTVSSFNTSLKKTLSFEPDNITVHTLAIKNASQLKQTDFVHKNEEMVAKMVDNAYKTLDKYAYYPYYLYRQKHMMANLENIGYSKSGQECLFNIDSMEEVSSILACGAGGISKRFFAKDNRIERYANIKDIPQYMAETKRITANKLVLFK